jgi:hypothetical protein
MDIQVYLETGSVRTFAGAVDWPGWCRSGRDEISALAALANYAPRYSRALSAVQIEFQTPVEVDEFSVIERLPGNATTDYGSPGAAPTFDAQPLDETELRRFQSILKACWLTLDAAEEAAKGTELRKGPRGGGRDLDAIVHHVLLAECAYLGRLGWKIEFDEKSDPDHEKLRIRQAVLDAITPENMAAVPPAGPRGGIRWKPRYFVRRVAWHILDHAWEIEDRLA